MIEGAKTIFFFLFGCLEVEDFFLGIIEEGVKISVSSRDCELTQIRVILFKAYWCTLLY